MADMMSRRERLAATFAGEPVDRVAVALWRHFPGDDQRPADLASATLSWQAQYDWDFMKVSPSSGFCLRDWGVEDRWVGGDEGARQYTKRAIHRPQDWELLRPLSARTGAIGGQLQALTLISEGLGSDVPFIQTVFSPLAQAKNLAGKEMLILHIRNHPSAVRTALEVITQSTLQFVEECKSRGIAGLYYAVQLASFADLSLDEYREFGEPYDRRILDAVRDLWFNMIHLHGTAGMFDLVSRYPAQALNWHDRESGPSLQDGQRIFPGAVCGGLEHWDDLLRGDPDLIRERVADALKQTGGRRLIVSSGCVAPVNAPFSNLRAVRAAVMS